MFENENLFFKDHEMIIRFINDLDVLIKKYKFNLETISNLCDMDFNKLELFYMGKGPLTYDEITIIQEVFIVPFKSAIKISKDNYKIAIRAQKVSKLNIKWH